MNTEFLESFLMVVECGSVAEAARRLGLSATAVSQRISVLDKEIGTQLFSRVGRTAQPTPAAAAIVESARRMVREAQEIKAIASTDRVVGEFRLGAVSSAINGLLPAMFKQLMQKHPGLELYVMPGASTELYEKLLAKEIDAALIVAPPFPLNKSYAWATVRTEPYVFLTPEKFAHRSLPDILRNEPFIRYDRKHWGGRLADAWLRKHDFAIKERFELDALDAIAILVSQGLGVSMVPEWPAPWPEGLRLNRVPMPVDPIVREIGFLWPRASLRRRHIEALLTEARLAYPPSNAKVQSRE